MEWWGWGGGGQLIQPGRVYPINCMYLAHDVRDVSTFIQTIITPLSLGQSLNVIPLFNGEFPANSEYCITN